MNDKRENNVASVLRKWFSRLIYFYRLIEYSRRVFRERKCRSGPAAAKLTGATFREPTPFLSSFLSAFRHLIRIFQRETVRSQATETEAIPDAARASQIAFAFSNASFVPRHFGEFPTFSISAEMLVNIGERKERGRLGGAGAAGRGLPKCEIMYKAGMNNDSAVIHCGLDASDIGLVSNRTRPMP